MRNPNPPTIPHLQVPNLVCNCVCLSPSGTEIVSGWSDGKVRAFGPQSGKLLYVINDAHKIIGVGNSSGGETPKNGALPSYHP